MSKTEIRNIEKNLLSDQWYTLHKVSFELKKKDGTWSTQSRECYDQGDGAVILLYNPAAKTVILTRQFRMPTYLNGNPCGMLIEGVAGKLDGESPAACIIRETEEEVGYQISRPTKVFELYLSPGAVTERLHFFIAEYTSAQKTTAGGGLTSESEEIEILEMKMDDALEKVRLGEIKDAKTVILLQYLRLNQIV